MHVVLNCNLFTIFYTAIVKKKISGVKKYSVKEEMINTVSSNQNSSAGVMITLGVLSL